VQAGDESGQLARTPAPRRTPPPDLSASLKRALHKLGAEEAPPAAPQRRGSGLPALRRTAAHIALPAAKPKGVKAKAAAQQKLPRAPAARATPKGGAATAPAAGTPQHARARVRIGCLSASRAGVRVPPAATPGAAAAPGSEAAKKPAAKRVKASDLDAGVVAAAIAAARAAGTLEKLSVAELKAFCKANKLQVGGKKADLVARVIRAP